MARMPWRTPAVSQHLNEETLLLLLDGLLEGRQAGDAEQHLKDCWECRSLKDRLDSSVRAFMEERRDDLSRQHASSTDRDRFAARLQRLADSPPQQEVRPFRLLRQAPRILWPVAAAAAALAATGAWAPIENFVADLATPEHTAILLAPPRHPAAPVLATRTSMPAAPSVTARTPTPAPPLSQPLPPIAAAPSPESLDAAELAAYLAMHQFGLCRGSGFEVLRIPGEAIRITGMAEDPEVSSLLRSAVANDPLIAVDITTPPSDLAPPSDFARSVGLLEARPPLLDKQLKEHFERHSPPGRAGRDMADYASLAMRLSTTASSEAQSLRTLAAVFTTGRIAAMDASSRRQLARAAADHLLEMQQSTNRLGQHLDQLGAFAPPEGSDPAEASWEQAAGLLGQYAARIDYLAAGLFGGLELQGLSATPAWDELRVRQRQCRSLLATALDVVQHGFRPTQSRTVPPITP